MIEQWRDIPGYVGRYQVSDLGRVRALSFMQRYLLRNGQEAFRRTKERAVAQQKINSGYLIVHLHLEGQRTALTVHRLVAAAFVPNPDALPEVNHRSGVKTDNRADNLEWVTRTANHLHAVKHRLNRQAVPVVDPATGERHDSIAQAARDAGVSPRTVAARFERAA